MSWPPQQQGPRISAEAVLGLRIYRDAENKSSESSPGKASAGREGIMSAVFHSIILYAWATSEVWMVWIATLASAITSSSLEASGSS